MLTVTGKIIDATAAFEIQSDKNPVIDIIPNKIHAGFDPIKRQNFIASFSCKPVVSIPLEIITPCLFDF